MRNWSELTPSEQKAVEKAYKKGKDPADIAPLYGLKPKQVSDQAYRKDWDRPAGAGKKAGKKSKKKASKKKAKKTVRKTAKKAKKAKKSKKSKKTKKSRR